MYKTRQHQHFEIKQFEVRISESIGGFCFLKILENNNKEIVNILIGFYLIIFTKHSQFTATVHSVSGTHSTNKLYKLKDLHNQTQMEGRKRHSLWVAVFNN